MQKTIGLIGGISWESSAIYYRAINQEVQRLLGGSHSCRSLLFSFDFNEIAVLQKKEDWETLTSIFIDAAKNLENAGADCILICANTMHKVAAQVAENINIPLLHIGDATAEAIKEAHQNKVGLLGTKFTMEQDFLKGRLSDLHGIEAIIPTENQRDRLHQIIYEELVKGVFLDSSRDFCSQAMNELADRGAEGMILGCTELGLLLPQEQSKHILFDTALLHAKKAVAFSLGK